eukprot:CAMPEP_0174907084 /NCGR_PEP_ID=MMETSP0167-20121228/59539_1 /TAXON_ID=38298 /ORGANISM="Rhodella maculata, Strain CCMP736" /LENGTH=342 /DNA_ID=CAMNT_0016150479 /DNA_START=19 /DNA_END=1047 /DNA_ORIENTATION=+
MVNPPLVETTRSGLVESFHRGAVCVIDAEGAIRFSLGDIDRRFYPHSAMKFVQALPLLESGAAEHFGLTDLEIAVICASHNGEAAHVDAVRGILGRAGLGPEDLGCGTHPSIRPATHEALLREGVTLSDIHSNCSGKHAGFLALARYLGAETEGYLQPSHEVQVRVREAVSDLYEVPAAELHLGIDGCSAPNYALSLRAMASAFRNLMRPERFSTTRQAAILRMRRAVAAHPFMLGGTDRFCSELTTMVGELILAKLGAQGIYCFGLKEKGWGVAIKIDDGLHGPQYQVVMAILDCLGLLPEGHGLDKWAVTPVTNCRGSQIGERRPTKELLQALADWEVCL